MPIFALVDCNNFFVSCERAMDPSLENRPVVVLSNNDGCIISRSNEAKWLGIPMGAPYFKVKALLQRHKVSVLSSQFQLYSVKSRQVVDALDQFSPKLEYYSIDEAFLTLNHIPPHLLREHAREMQATVLQQTGIPVSIGLAETKTLAKLANGIAKKAPRFQGVLNLYHSSQLDMALSRVSVGSVWGVGYRLSKSLQAASIYTARDLRDTDDQWILKRYSVVLLRTVMELRGHACLPMLDKPPPRKMVMYSRSFGSLIESLPLMENAIASFVARAAEKLREDGMTARYLSIYMRTSRYLGPESRYSNRAEVILPAYTDCTHTLIRAANKLTRHLFREGYAYYKAAVVLGDLMPLTERQISLFEAPPETNRLQTLMQTVDKINRTYGTGTLQYGAEGQNKFWLPRHLKPAEVRPSEAMLKLDPDKPIRRPLVGFVHPIHG